MILANKLNITDQIELAKEEERISVTIQRAPPKCQEVLRSLFEGVCGQGWVYGVPQNALWRGTKTLPDFSH